MTTNKTAQSKNSSPKKPSEKGYSHEATPNHVWWMVFLSICMLSVATRLYKIDEPDHVCWDETHFGKMGSWYINRTFFFDVHPPLGKMMVGAFGYMTGYDGTFPFIKPGDKYENTKYLGMRICCALLGATLPPFAFVAVWEMTFALHAATFAAALLIFDIGMLTLTQYILLDPPLLCFIMGAVMGIAKVDSYKNRPFSVGWWVWLTITGGFLACAISVKFVGLFVVLYVGIHTISQLWDIMGDLNKPVLYTVQHFVARAACLIVLPVILYVIFFYIHLSVLYKTGPGDGHFSSAFQSLLEGNTLHNSSMPREVAYGSRVSLKQYRTGGGYLHSHAHLYPEGVGARQQQITTYGHKDVNNEFLIKPYDRVYDAEAEVKLLRSGDLLRLEHITTGRNLHSHKEPSSVTKRHYQVTGYGENGTGDANDVWKVIIPGSGEDREIVKTVTTQFQLIHYLSGCALYSHNTQLPKWGFEQMEVTCNPNIRDKNSHWNIEDNIFERLPNVSIDVFAPNFLQRFIESHAVMLQSNAGLKPKEGEMTSQPWHWPINLRGQYFSAPPYRVYLLGNPIIWWVNLAFLFLFIALYIFHSIREQRGCEDSDEVKATRGRMHMACGWLFLGWALHYVPFWAMGRVLYFHHYFPATLFSSSITGIVLNYFLESIPYLAPAKIASVFHHWFVAGIFSVIVYSFYLFAPLAYGMDGPESTNVNSTMYGLKWMESWEF